MKVQMWDRVIWDVHPQDFNSQGDFQKLLAILKSSSFQDFIDFELENVKEYLDAWQILLETAKPPTHQSLQGCSLHNLFLATPSLSGVLYLSHNHVVSESLFHEDPHKLSHPTDRLLDETILKMLPSAKDLTFSFPRKYSFDGFYNSWGFIRIERDHKENGRGILLSVTTLDARVMSLMKRHGFQHLGDLYNKAWDGAIHDYIHHIALYTNPSFGIGKISPMSLANEHFDIDNWGTAMIDTFNYEYFSHRTHRAITERLITQQHKQVIIENAKIYFKEVHDFLQTLLKHEDCRYAQKISNYLTSIYLWPTHILLHPLDCVFDQLEEYVNRLKVDPSLNNIKEVLIQLQAVNVEASQSNNPKDIALNAMINGLKLKEKIAKETVSWFDVMRFSTDLIVQRGMYEGWFHQESVKFDHTPITPSAAMWKMIEALQNTLARLELKSHDSNNYVLQGIVP